MPEYSVHASMSCLVLLSQLLRLRESSPAWCHLAAHRGSMALGQGVSEIYLIPLLLSLGEEFSPPFPHLHQVTKG